MFFVFWLLFLLLLLFFVVFLTGRKTPKVEVAVVGCRSLISLMVSVDVKQHLKKLCTIQSSVRGM